VPVQGRQIPAKAESGRSSLSANQVGRLAWRSSYSQKLVAGTTQRNSGFGQPRQ
jgi:hypothetical protein